MKTIGIFLAGQQGDIMSAMSVLKYRNELWGDDHKIIWYADKNNFDLFKYQDIEVREFPRGFGYPNRVKEENDIIWAKAGDKVLWEDWEPLVDENNHLNIELAKNYPSLEGIDIGHFPAPHQLPVEKRLAYPLCSKKVFGVNMDLEWHPVLAFSDEEMDLASDFLSELPDKRIVCLETMAGSGQSLMNDEQVRKSMQICRDILGECNFIFMSHKYLNGNEKFPEDLLLENHFCSDFTVRQCALIVDYAEILISVSSGITVAASCWGNTSVPIMQFCGSDVCSTRAMALGRFELVTHDEKPLHVAQEEYYSRLKLLLNEIK